ncbi:hypothetical protein CMO93_04885 [Candidatus Woesearchaeota archaeon]|nr:hypothetical protein [Candidatus Woesearchaeota archaeon]
MGFLKFLKRDKKQESNLDLDKLDVPPSPPNVKGKEFTELPELPELDEPLSRPTKKPVSEFDAPTIPLLEPQKPIKEPSQTQIPKPLFGAPKLEPQMSPIERGIPKPSPKLEIEPEIRPHRKYEERFERAAVKEEKEVLMHKEVKGPIYIRVDRFRQILAGISTIKGDLKKGDSALLTINEIDVNSDKEFEKWKNVMADMQKKLIFIDKSLFKR